MTSQIIINLTYDHINAALSAVPGGLDGILMAVPAFAPQLPPEWLGVLREVVENREPVRIGLEWRKKTFVVCIGQ